MENDGCEPEAEKKDSMQEHPSETLKDRINQTIGIDLSRGLCDHSLMREVGGGNWSRKKVAKLTYSYLPTLAS